MDAQFTGKQIAERRKELGLTQKDLAEKLHVTDKAVSKWERGLNFPDLGLMENLADALETTAANLLGLETASRDEIVSSVTEISAEQLEEAKREIHRIGWGCLLAAALLTAAYLLFGNNVERTQKAYMILHCVIIAIAVAGLYLLVKYGQIRKIGVGDIFIAYGALGALAVHMGWHWITGYSIHEIPGAILIAACVCLTQWLFCRIMTPQFAKTIPLLGTVGFALWQISLRHTYWISYVPAACCLVTWLIWTLKNRKKEPIP